MEKKIRFSLIIILTILTSAIIQLVDRYLDFSLILICPLILAYYFLLTKLKILIKSSYILFEKVNDRIIGIDIAATESIEELGIPINKGYIYEATKLRHIVPFFKENANMFTFNETIIDLGSGKGSALIALKKVGFKKVYGVEISEKLCEISNMNLMKLKIDDVIVYNSDILDFSHYENFEIFYMYNPFPAEIIRNVILKIEQSLIKSPRNVTIIYMNPKHHDEIENNKIFNRLGEFNYDSEKSSFRNIYVYQN